MRIVFRPLQGWPQKETKNRLSDVFRAGWEDTLKLLEYEARCLGAAELVLQVALSETEIRRDGWPRANAWPSMPGVIVSLDSKHGPLEYRTDRYRDWRANVRAIALSLEALRKVDRYGVAQSGEQYRGWNALGSGIPMPEAKQMTRERAMTPDQFEEAVRVALQELESQEIREIWAHVVQGDLRVQRVPRMFPVELWGLLCEAYANARGLETLVSGVCQTELLRREGADR